MREWIAAILTTSVCYIGFAQIPVSTGWLDRGESPHFVEAYSSFSFASAQASNQFLNSLLRQPYLSSDQIAMQSDRLKTTSNVLGGDFEMGLKLKFQFPNSSHAVLFKAANNEHFDGNWSKAGFDLAFKGNKVTAGDSVSLSPINFGFYRFQQVAFGWSYQKHANTGISILASYINGASMMSAVIDQGWVYTSALGDTLSAGLLGAVAISDTNQKQIMAPNGRGLGLDFGFSHAFEANSIWRVNFDVYNLGMIQWSSKTIRARSDSAIVFTGIALGNIKTLKNRLSEDVLSDSLNNAKSDFVHQSYYNTWLPGYAHLHVMQESDRGMELGGGVVARWKVNYNPYAYLVCGWRFKTYVAAYADLGYGGYTKAQVGMRAAVNVGDLAFNARFGNLEALITPTKLAGMSGMISMGYIW